MKPIASLLTVAAFLVIPVGLPRARANQDPNAYGEQVYSLAKTILDASMGCGRWTVAVAYILVKDHGPDRPPDAIQASGRFYPNSSGKTAMQQAQEDCSQTMPRYGARCQSGCKCELRSTCVQLHQLVAAAPRR